MRTLTVLAVFLVSISLCAAKQYSNSNVGQIGFQVHSWDDLRGWEQGFWKGVQWMKIDVHWMPADFCANQTRVAQDPRGCFVLTHDPPPQNCTVQYYSTQSVLDYITSDQYSHFFKQPNFKISIALCFKYTYGNVCNSTSEDAQNWFSLTDDLFKSYNAAVQKNHLNVEFILDGTAATANCTAESWRPWVKTWSGPTAEPAFTVDSKIDGMDRLIVLDPPIYEHDAIEIDPAYWVKEYSSKDYGKFANSTYPWLWWEPSNQDTIQTVCDTYLGTEQFHEQGFLFAINIDPVLFQVFSASETKDVAWNYPIDSGSDIYAARPFVSVLPAPSKDLYYVIVAYYLDDLLKKDYYYYVFSTDNILGSLITVQDKKSLSTNTNITAITNMKTVSYQTASGSSNLTLIADKVGGFEGYQLTPAGSLQRYCSNQLPNAKKISYSSFDLFVENNQLYLLQAYTLGQNDLQYQLYELDPVTCHVTACGQVFGSTLSFHFSSLSIAVNPTTPGIYEGVVTLSNNDDQIYAAYVTISIDSQCQTQIFSTATTQPIDVGTDSVVSSVVVDKQPMIMEVHGNGYCWNSANHNKGSKALMCDNQPVAVNHVLAYNYGPNSGWFQHIQDSLQLSSCSPYVVSGSYDGGSYPFATLFPSIDGSDAGVIAVHQGIGKLERVDEAVAVKIRGDEDCGMPVSHPGLVIDSWPLPAVTCFTN